MTLQKKQQSGKLNFLLIMQFKKKKNPFHAEIPHRALFGKEHYGAENSMQTYFLRQRANRIPPIPMHPLLLWVMSCLLQPPPKNGLKTFPDFPAGPQPKCMLSGFSSSSSQHITPGLIWCPVASGSSISQSPLRISLLPECQLPFLLIL